MQQMQSLLQNPRDLDVGFEAGFAFAASVDAVSD
jgi:hypothetical protein